jgi:hypothetical protein
MEKLEADRTKKIQESEKRLEEVNKKQKQE